MRYMKSVRTLVLLAAASMSVQLKAQDIDGILHSVEENNVELKAIKKSGEAQSLDIRMQNNLEDPSVEYSPFFAKGVSGVASSELIVKQGFDFPTVYAARSKSGKLQREIVGLNYLTSRRDVLHTAKQLCLDMVLLNKERRLLDLRRKNADELLALYEKKMQHGEATIIELNKVKMDRMTVETELTDNDAAHRTALEALLALNGNMPLDGDITEYPASTFAGDYEALCNRAVEGELTLKTAGTEVKASAQQLKVNRQNWMPKFEVGYRRNTDGSEASNGFLVGASFPLFSNRHKLKSAKARLEESELALDNARKNTESEIRAKVNEMRLAKKAADVYDVDLLYSTLGLLRKAVEGGQMSVTDYYVEADGVYRNLQAHMRLENKYQKLMAEVCKNEL